MSRQKDCGHRSGSGNRRPRKGCRCVRCEELRAARRERRKVDNMTEEQRETKNAGQRVENISDERRERRNAAQRVENMTPAQLRKHREAGAERSRLYRQRKAAERAAEEES